MFAGHRKTGRLPVFRPHWFSICLVLFFQVKQHFEFPITFIKRSTLRFLDVKHFLALDFLYSKFLIVYGSELEKFHFPYEFLDRLKKLENGLPDHQAFYSSLTKSNITTEKYNLVQKTWLEKGWKSLRDMLV